MAPRKKASAAVAATQLSGQRIQSLGAFKFGGGRLATEEESSPGPYDIPQHLRVYIQHIGKSDPRTREKAMRSLTDYLAASPSDTEVQALLMYWAKQLPKMSLSPAACHLTLVLSKRAGKAMGRVINNVFPPLFFGQFAQEAALSKAASDALQGMLGNKLDAAVCEVCLDRTIEAIQAIGSASGSPGSCPSPYPPTALLSGAKYTLDRMRSTKRDATRVITLLQSLDEKKWLRSTDADTRRQAYSVCQSLAAFSATLDRKFVRNVYSCLKTETEVANYAEMLSMILAFGRDAETWAAVEDQERDFHLPLRRIGSSVNESETLAKCFLPLLAVTPRSYWADGSLARLLLTLLLAPKEERETVRECVQYVIANGMFHLIGDYVRIFTGEDALRRLSLLVGALPAAKDRRDRSNAADVSFAQFAAFEAEVLEQSLLLPISFWENGNIDFAYRISEKIGSCDCRIRALVEELYRRLLERAAVSGLEAGLVDTMARIVEIKIIDAGQDDFDHIIQNLRGRLGASVTAKIVDSVSLAKGEHGSPEHSAIRTNLLQSIALEAVSTGDEGMLRLAKSLVRFTPQEQMHACLQDCVAAAVPRSALPQAPNTAFSVVLSLMSCVASHSASVLSDNRFMLFVLQAVWNNLEVPAILSSAEIVLRSQDDISVFGTLLDEGDFMDVVDAEDAAHRLYCLVSFCVASARHGHEVSAYLGFAETMSRFPDVPISIIAHQPVSFLEELVLKDVDAVLDALHHSHIDEREDVLRLALSSPASYVSLIDRAFEREYSSQEYDFASKGGGAVELIKYGIFLDETLDWCRSTLFTSVARGHEWSASNWEVFEAAVSCVRQDISLFERSGLATFSVAALRATTTETSDASLLTSKLVPACFPDSWSDERENQSCDPRDEASISDDADDGDVDKDDGMHPNVLCGSYRNGVRSLHNNGPIGWGDLRPQVEVWYSGTTTVSKGTILSRDDTILPPSFVIDKGDGTVRETEASRLRLLRVGALLLGSPGIWKRPIIDSAEMDEAIRVLIASSDKEWISGADLAVLRALGAHGWERLPEHPNNVREVVMERVVDHAMKAAVEMDAVISRISQDVTERANAATGASYSEAIDALDLLWTARGNEVLRRAPPMVHLYDHTQEALEAALVSFVEGRGEVVAAAVRVFLCDFWEASNERRLKRHKLASSIVSIFYGIGWLMAASRAILPTPMDVWLRPDVQSVLGSVSYGVRAVDAFCPDALEDLQTIIGYSLLPSQILSLCLNCGVSRSLAAAAFAVLLRRPEDISMAWSTDPDLFFEDDSEAGEVSEVSEAGVDGKGEVRVRGAARDKLLDLNPLLRAAIEGNPDSDEYQIAWLILTAYLASPYLDETQQELLVLTLKDTKLASAVLSRTLLELTERCEWKTESSLDPKDGNFGNEELMTYLRMSSLDVPPDVRLLCLLSTMPGAARSWYLEDLTVKQHRGWAEEFVERNVAPLLTKRELKGLETIRDGEDFTIKVTGNMVLATLNIEDDQSAVLKIQIPTLFPLAAPNACLEKAPGAIGPERARRWKMTLELALRSRHDISGAITMWRRNVSRVFDCSDNCLICFALLDGAGRLPRHKCRSCGVVTHLSCLRKWMATSGSSRCVHCQT